MNNTWVYDLEQYKNLHTCCAINIKTDEVKKFVIHESRDERRQYLGWLSSGIKMIGYNNLAYDYPMLHKVLRNKSYFLSAPIGVVVNWMYRNNEEIFNTEYSAIRKKHVIIPQLDLLKIWHFDNNARRTSLKWVEFAMQMDNIEDLPIPPGSNVDAGDVNSVLDYNLHDVRATLQFYKLTRGDTFNKLYKGEDKLDLRKKLGNIYNVGLMNANDPEIGSKIILKLYCEKTNKDSYRVSKQRTYRSQIDLGSCIFPYVKFETDEFKSVYNFFKNKVITETKGSLTEIPWSECQPDLLTYASRAKKSWDPDKKQLKHLNVEYKGLKYVYGTGGIHGSRTGIFEEDEDHVIIDSDVTSLYPYIMVQNNLYPKHLGPEFLEVYEKDILDIRIAAKHRYKAAEKALAGSGNPIDNVYNKGLKLALNGTYGKLNDQYSFLYDPLIAMKITVNGQLMLSMLAERIGLQFPKAVIIQINTDGLTLKLHKDHVEDYYKLCAQWEKETKLALEHAKYAKFIVRDVELFAS